MSANEPRGLDLFPPEASLPPTSQPGKATETDPRLLFGSEDTLFVEIDATAPAAYAPVDEPVPQPDGAGRHVPDIAEARPGRRVALGLLGAVLAVKVALALAIRASWIPMPDMFVAAGTSAAAASVSEAAPTVTSSAPPHTSSPPAIPPPSEPAFWRAAASRRWEPAGDVKPAAVTRPHVTPAQVPRPQRAEVRRAGEAESRPIADSLSAHVVTSAVAPVVVSAPDTALIDPLTPPPLPPPPAATVASAPLALERVPLPMPAASRNVGAAPPAEPASRATVGESPAVERALDGYRDAFSQLDVEAAQAVWPTVNAKSLERAFSQLQSQQVTFRDCAISVATSQAYATCEGTAHYVPKVGNRDPRTEQRTWNFTLSREGQRWVILAVNSR